MRKYHKLTNLSIVIILLVSLMFNFTFPHIALANETGKNKVLSINLSETIRILPFAIGETSISLMTIANNENKRKEYNKVRELPIEPTIDKSKEIIIALTEAKMVIANEDQEDLSITSEEENDKLSEQICADAGITTLPCWQDLKVMREKESFSGKAMTGDGGRSRGWYHIQTKMHKVSVECALDFKCSTEWTVKNLLNNGYKTNRLYAISRHNGSGLAAQAYARNVVYLSAKFAK